MKLFFDTSALIKCYIDEPGSDAALELFDKADGIYVSAIAEIEMQSTIRRLLAQKAISRPEYQTLTAEFESDFLFFNTVELTEDVILTAKKIVDLYQLKTLDSIQLSSVITLPEEIDAFIVCDQKLIKAGEKENLKIIRPQ